MDTEILKFRIHFAFQKRPKTIVHLHRLKYLSYLFRMGSNCVSDSCHLPQDQRIYLDFNQDIFSLSIHTQTRSEYTNICITQEEQVPVLDITNGWFSHMKHTLQYYHKNIDIVLFTFLHIPTYKEGMQTLKQVISEHSLYISNRIVCTLDTSFFDVISTLVSSRPFY